MNGSSLCFYPHGIMYNAYCIQCCMGVPHFTCLPSVSTDLTKALLKTMTDKVEEHNNNGNGPQQQQWAPFQPSFNGRPSEPHPHPFNYEQQHRERPQAEFNNETNQQQTAPFMQHFFPRIGLPFPDFTDYQRFNGFQRNAFFPNPFAPQFPSSAYSFPAMHNPMTGMDNFNLPHNQHQFSQNSSLPKSKEETGQERPPNQEEDKPPVLSVEYCLNKEAEMKFNSNNSDFPMHDKEEPPKDPIMKMGRKEKDSSFSFPPSLAAEKPFEQGRARDDLMTFNPPFYSSPMEMGSNNSFKQEVPTVNNTPPEHLHDCQVCLSTHANGLHFGARTCAACAAFFRRTISDDKRYVCKRNQRCTNASRDGTGYRKICRCCRMKRCLEIGMLPENVQHKRNRRDSGSPHQKTPFDTFFNGFYPTFSSATANAPPTTLQSDTCRNSS